MTYLFGRMQREYLIDELPINCDEIQKKIAQPEIVIKVLLNYIIKKTKAASDENAASGENAANEEKVFEFLNTSLNPPPFSYHGSQFKEYLRLLGTSLEEIHSILIDPSIQSNEYLAEKMGISDSELSLIIEPTLTPELWEKIKTMMLLDFDETGIPNKDLEFFKDLFSIRDRVDAIDSILKKIDGSYENPFDFLLDIIGVDPNISHIDSLAFKKMFQFYILNRSLKIDIVDLLIILRQLDVKQLTYDIVEKVHNIIMMLSKIEISPRMLLELKDDELKLEKIANILYITRETLEKFIQMNNISDITNTPIFYEILKIIQELNNFDASAETFFRLKIPFVNHTTQPLEEFLGYSENEILNAIDSEDEDHLIKVLGISKIDLGILFKLGIQNESSTEIDSLSKLKAGGLEALDLLLRPFRVANFLGLDLTEFGLILELIGPLNGGDPNSMTYEQIMKAFEIVRFIRKIGLSPSGISKITTKSESESDLKDILEADDQWWEEYIENKELRIRKLAEKLNYSQHQIESFIYRRGASERHYVTEVRPLNTGNETLYLVCVEDEIRRNYGDDWKLYNPFGDSYYTISGESLGEKFFRIIKEPTDLSVGDVIEIVKTPKNLSWIKIDNTTKLRKRTDSIRRWISLAQEFHIDIISVFNELLKYDYQFKMSELNESFYEVCLLTVGIHELKNIVPLLSWEDPIGINQFNTLEQVKRVYYLLNLAKYLNLDLKTIERLNLWEYYITNENLSTLINILEQSFEKEQFESEIEKANSSILEITRDSLLAYAISPNFPCTEEYPQTIKLLSNELLIDLQTSKNVYTNEILQAIESLQTYIIRVQTGQENIDDLKESHFLAFINSLTTVEDFTEGILNDPSRWYDEPILGYGITPEIAQRILDTREQLGGFTEISQLEAIEGLEPIIIENMIYTYRLAHATQLRGEWWEKMEKDWKWMQRYVLWEAAQKIYLFPENYLMPELRDRKTPFFEELEEDLSQGEVTQALAEKTISGYIDNLHPISSLHVSGNVYDKEKKSLHIFARSHINEKDTFYRYLENQKVWSPWVKIPIEINADRLQPFLAYNRLYIFWIETEVDTSETPSHKHNLCFAYSMDMKKWSKKKIFKLVHSDDGYIFTNIETLWLGVYLAGGINIYINDTPPLFDWDLDTHPPYRLNLTCQDNIDFIPLDHPLKVKQFNFIDWNFVYPSNFITISDIMNFFYKDCTSSAAVMGYINEKAEPNEPIEWPGKATISKGLINFLFCDGSNLRLISGVCKPFVGSTVFEDNFDDNLLDNNWTNFPKKGFITEQEGILQFRSEEVCDWWYFGDPVLYGFSDAPHVIYPISSGYENYWGVKIKIEYPTSVFPGNHYGLMLYRNDKNVWFYGHHSLEPPYYDQSLRIEKIVNSICSNNINSVGLEFYNMKYLRIEKYGDTYYFDYSMDGDIWTNFYSTNSLGFTPTHIGLFKKNWYHSEPTSVHFDDFSIYNLAPLSNISLRKLNSKILIDNINSKFKIDNAIGIGRNSYFFCSDQYRCFIIIVHLELIAGKVSQNISIRQLNYGKHCQLKDKLFRQGLDEFYNPNLQIEDLQRDFNEIYNIPSTLSIAAEELPSRKLEFHGPNKLYNWELFFHIPYLIAEGLSQNRKFESASEWYEYIFNPYIRPDLSNIEEEVQWKFRPFREEIDEDFDSYIYDPEDIDIWINDPFNPHALARVRPFTYQKSILLSYIENLLEWADQDFTRDTQESINSARIRYLFVERLLDLSEFEEEIPQSIGGRRTLSTMNDALDDIPIETPVDPYSLEAMLINVNIGCIPENPIFKSLLYQLESNLRKIRTGRNIAGIKRILPLFEASIDPMAAITAVASGIGLENLNYSTTSNIGPYRFVFLIERAKSLANLVIQAGNALLNAIEKKETEELSYLKAQQELRLSKANIHIRKLHVIETQDSLKMAEEQTIRSQFIKDHYQGLINRGKNEYEKSALRYLDLSIILLYASMGLQASAAAAHLIPTVHITTGMLPSVTTVTGGESIARNLGALAGISSTEASVLSHRSSIAGMNANFARREEEWTFQKDLAMKDENLSRQNEIIAKDRVKIAEMEQEIAEMQAEFADATLEFLKEKFTNKELYKWMVKTLSKMLYGFYNLAYTAARMAQATMEFERNETYDFISYGYWDSERKGLLSGDQLLLDINRMDEAYIKNNVRKLEITKHISLAQMAPEAIIKLREEGKAIFSTPMTWYDCDFPGHFQRIIKCVRFSLLALVGPGINVNATLSTVSSSEVVINPKEGPILLPRMQSVALSGASNSSGLFELNYRDERYLPFEGSGVAVTWEIEMPKASNKFDFDTIIDVILSIGYTALSDSEYKKRIIEELGTTWRGMVPISVITTFPDAWYHFNNPIFNVSENSPEPYSLVFSITNLMFPPNEEEQKLESVTLYFGFRDSKIQVPLKIKYTSEKGRIVNTLGKTGTDGTLLLGNLFTGFSPFGDWEIKIDRERIPENFLAKDDYGNLIKVQYGDNEIPKLNTEIITNLIIGLSYKAEQKWPSQE